MVAFTTRAKFITILLSGINAIIIGSVFCFLMARWRCQSDISIVSSPTFPSIQSSVFLDQVRCIISNISFSQALALLVFAAMPIVIEFVWSGVVRRWAANNNYTVVSIDTFIPPWKNPIGLASYLSRLLATFHVEIKSRHPEFGDTEKVWLEIGTLWFLGDGIKELWEKNLPEQSKLKRPI